MSSAGCLKTGPQYRRFLSPIGQSADETKAATLGDVQTTLRHLREMTKNAALHLLPIIWFGRAAGILRPGHGFLGRPRAGTVKVGRRADINLYCAMPRPHLDGGEHDGILSAMGRLA